MFSLASVMNKSVKINASDDSLYDLVQEVISSSLTLNEFKRMLQQKHYHWSNFLMKSLVSMYCNLTQQTTLHRKIIPDTELPEPIMIYQDKRRNNELITVFCIPMVTSLLVEDLGVQVTGVNKRISGYVLPKTFDILQDNMTESSFSLNSVLSNHFIKLFVMANHAAYHYYSFLRRGDFDYSHEHVKDVSGKLKSDFFNINDLISSKPNGTVERLIRNDRKAKIPGRFIYNSGVTHKDVHERHSSNESNVSSSSDSHSTDEEVS